jgi:hypothetical protein
MMYFRFDWSTCRLLVLNRGWKRDSLQIMLFGYVCSTWGTVELKMRFEAWITRNYVKGVSLFYLSYLITVMAYLCSQRTPNVQINYFMFVPSTDYLCLILAGILISSNDDFRKCFLDMMQGWTKNAFWYENIKNDVNGFLHLPNLISLVVYLCSQWTPHIQIKYFMFDFSIYSLFEINRGWKRDSLQILIFVYVCSAWGIVELKIRFEAWITRNGESFFHFPDLITLMAYPYLQCTPHVQIKCYTFDRSIYRLFVLNRGEKRDSLEIIIFVYVCSPWGIVERKMRFVAWIRRNDVNDDRLFHFSYLITFKAYQC